MKNKKQIGNLSISGGRLQITALFLLRMVIGWHFLYEGLSKIFTPGWTSKGYLLSSDWIFSGIFRAMAQSSGLLSVIDIINMALLTLVGISLIFGIYTRIANLTGASLVLFYYVAHPPFGSMSPFMPAEGIYLIVDKNLVEFFAFLVLAVFPASAFPGFDRIRAFFHSRRLYNHLRPQKQKIAEEPPQHTGFSTSRRELLQALLTLPFFGGFVSAYLNKIGWFSHEEEALRKTDSVTGVTRVFNFAKLEDLKGSIPSGKIGEIEISRIILGGNLINAGAHARDLIYVSPLLRKYFTDKKIIETWFMAEKSGINTMSFWPNERSLRLLKEYRQCGGKMQWLGHANGIKKDIQACVDYGAVGIYIAGDNCERIVFGGRVDELGKAVDLIKKNNVFAGITSHAIGVIKTCEEYGVNVDFYHKTLHHDRYWSATPKEKQTVDVRYGDPAFRAKGDRNAQGHYYDNMWCIDTEETIAYMKNLPKPWIAFKVLAAGAIEPADGFKYAFDNGADFIHVGMFDFQIVEDVNICAEILAGRLAGMTTRTRPWYG
jgi:uncharacterized membrane protein YphA (DoxX/SURF4 family)